MAMSRILEFFIDTHRKALILRSETSKIIAILDTLPHALDRKLYEETIHFSEIVIARRSLGMFSECVDDNYRYSVTEEAICLENQEKCTSISYIVNIMCINQSKYREEDVVELVKCIASK